jgi:hypothetical protein
MATVGESSPFLDLKFAGKKLRIKVWLIIHLHFWRELLHNAAQGTAMSFLTKLLFWQLNFIH